MVSASAESPYISIDVGPFVPNSRSISDVSSVASAERSSTAGGKIVAIRYCFMIGTGPNGVRRVRGATMAIVSPVVRPRAAAESRERLMESAASEPAAERSRSGRPRRSF